MIEICEWASGDVPYRVRETINDASQHLARCWKPAWDTRRLAFGEAERQLAEWAASVHSGLISVFVEDKALTPAVLAEAIVAQISYNDAGRLGTLGQLCLALAERVCMSSQPFFNAILERDFTSKIEVEVRARYSPQKPWLTLDSMPHPSYW